VRRSAMHPSQPWHAGRHLGVVPNGEVDMRELSIPPAAVGWAVTRSGEAAGWVLCHRPCLPIACTVY
jgi:hypothetical protein